jgi:transposase InsO family protein
VGAVYAHRTTTHTGRRPRKMDLKPKFPAAKTNEPRGNKVWKRPIVVNNIDIEQIKNILQDLHETGQPTNATSSKCEETHDTPIKVYKYKKVEDRIRPVPALMPEDVKVQRTYPEDPLKNLPPLPNYAPAFMPTKRITQERMDKLAIDENPDLLEEEKRLLKYILVLNERGIAFDEDERGTFRRDYFSDYQIPVTAHVPWADKNIPLPPGQREEIIRMLKEKIAAGVYEKTQSSYRSRWFCVQKKNGELRIVHDLQKLNSVTIRDTGVPPILDEFVEAYAGRSVYSVLDMYWGFYARILDPRSRDMTAFQTPLGVLRITSLPMGFTNSPAEFQACMVFLLQDEIPEVAGVFIDDIPVKGPAKRYFNKDGEEERREENPGIRRFIWEHLNDLHRILHRIGEAGGTVSGKKMQLCKNEVEIVGQKCCRDGRVPTETRTQRIRDWPIPINVSEVRGFLGLCGTVRIWIKNYSEISRPLVDLTRHDHIFEWGPQQEKAFQQLKTVVSQAPALRPIDYKCGRPVILSVDSSIYGIGFVLSQDDEKGRRVPARYGSLPVSQVQKGYGQSKLELYGLFKALREFRIYLVGAPKLIVEVDASSIKGMLNNPDVQASEPLNRWIRKVLMYDFELVHVPGRKHKAPDALSRRRYTSADEPLGGDSEDSLDEEPFSTKPQPIDPPEPTIRVGIAHQRDKEQEIRDIIHFLETYKPPATKYARDRQRFLHQASRHYLQEGRLYRRHASGNNQRVLTNPADRKKILEDLHDGIGHRGEWAVWEAIRIRFYWPGMRQDVTQYVKSCHTCQLRSTKKMHIPITLSQPVALFRKVYLDLMKMPEAQGKNWIVACRDDLSGTAEARALAADNARALASFFIEQVIFRYGTVIELVTDNGSSLGGEFARLVSKYNIHQIKISAYNSQANGVVERGHFTLREALVKMCEGNISKWPTLLPAAVFADRITIRRATGFSPYYLLHGTHPLLPCDLAEATFMVPQFKDRMTDIDLLIARTRQIAKMPEDLARAKNTLQKSRFRSKEAFEAKFGKRIRRTAFSPGELVLIRNNHNEKTVSIKKKIENRYMGPYRVIRETQGKAYVLEELNGNILRTSVAAFRLIPYVKREHLDGWARIVEEEDQE